MTVSRVFIIANGMKEESRELSERIINYGYQTVITYRKRGSAEGRKEKGDDLRSEADR